MAAAEDRPRPSHQPPPSAGLPIGRPVTPATPAAPKARPDPRPSRLGLGLGAIAAASIIAAGMIRFPVADVDAISADVSPTETTEDTLNTARPEVRIKHRTVYVQLKRGQKAPKGAKVISGAVPTPRVVVTRIAAKPASTRRVQSTPRKVARTRQSGR